MEEMGVEVEEGTAGGGVPAIDAMLVVQYAIAAACLSIDR